MIKVVAVVKAKDGMAREEFLSAWHDEHPAYVRRLPGIRRYTQSPALDHRKSWPYSGMAELWFESVADVKTAFDDAAAADLFAHEEEFLASVEWFLADEHEITL